MPLTMVNLKTGELYPYGDEWKRIETAPKDAPIVVWSSNIDDDEAGEIPTHWVAEASCWDWETISFFCPNRDPTWWRPAVPSSP